MALLESEGPQLSFPAGDLHFLRHRQQHPDVAMGSDGAYTCQGGRGPSCRRTTGSWGATHCNGGAEEPAERRIHTALGEEYSGRIARGAHA